MRPLAFLLALAAASPLAAQESDHRVGLWYGVGISAAWAGVSCDFCRNERDLGPAASVRAGITLGPGVLLGLEVDAWTTERNEVREVLTATGLVARVYPRPRGGPFIEAGIGPVFYRAEDELSATTVGVHLGAGHELPIGGRLSITNRVGLTASGFGRLVSEGQTVAEPVGFTLLHFGLALTWR